MASRVSNYRKVFSGSLYPDSVLVSVRFISSLYSLKHTTYFLPNHHMHTLQQNMQAHEPKTKAGASELRQRGPLEIFEAFINSSGSSERKKASAVESLRQESSALTAKSESNEPCNPLDYQMDRILKHISTNDR